MTLRDKMIKKFGKKVEDTMYMVGDSPVVFDTWEDAKGYAEKHLLFEDECIEEVKVIKYNLF